MLDDLLDEIDVLQDVRMAEAELEQGKGVSSSEAKRLIFESLKRCG